MSATFATVAAAVRHAIVGLQQLGHVMGTDRDLGTVLTDLDRIHGVLTARIPAPPKNAEPVGPAEFKAAAMKVWPHHAEVSEAGWETGYILYRVKGLTLAEYLATSREQRGQWVGDYAKDIAAWRAKHKPAPKTSPAPEPKTEPKGKAAEPVQAQAAQTATAPKASPAPAPKAADKPRCKANKADGTPCQSTIVGADGLCKAHAKQAAAAKPKAKHPAAGTVLVADGKGGTRPATEADLWAALDRLTGKAAAA